MILTSRQLSNSSLAMVFQKKRSMLVSLSTEEATVVLKKKMMMDYSQNTQA